MRTVFRTFAQFSAQPDKCLTRPGPDFRTPARFPANSHSFFAQSRKFVARPETNFRTNGAGFPHARAVLRTFAQFFRTIAQILTRPETNFRSTGAGLSHARAVFAHSHSFFRASAKISNAAGAGFSRDQNRIPTRSRSFCAQSRSFSAQSRKIIMRPAPKCRAAGTGFSGARTVFRAFAQFARTIAQMPNATGAGFSRDREVFRTFAQFYAKSRKSLTRPASNFDAARTKFPYDRSRILAS